MSTPSDVQAAITAIEARQNLRTIEIDPEHGVLAVPDGVSIVGIKQYLDEYRDAPERKRGTATLLTLDAFIAHVLRTADPQSVIFADPEPAAPSLLAVYDYQAAEKDGGEPRFAEHRALYPFPLADEWKAWKAAEGKSFSQADFAALLEERVTDVGDPAKAGDVAKQLAELLGATFAAPARLLELSRGLAVHVGEQVKSTANLATGEIDVQYVAKHETTGAAGERVKVPSAFLLSIPVFRGGAVYQVPVRLRYRVRDGQITWSVVLHRADLVFEHAFREACGRAEKETGLPLFVGKPEA